MGWKVRSGYKRVPSREIFASGLAMSSSRLKQGRCGDEAPRLAPRLKDLVDWERAVGPPAMGDLLAGGGSLSSRRRSGGATPLVPSSWRR